MEGKKPGGSLLNLDNYFLWVFPVYNKSRGVIFLLDFYFLMTTYFSEIESN